MPCTDSHQHSAADGAAALDRHTGPAAFRVRAPLLPLLAPLTAGARSEQSHVPPHEFALVLYGVRLQGLQAMNGRSVLPRALAPSSDSAVPSVSTALSRYVIIPVPAQPSACVCVRA